MAAFAVLAVSCQKEINEVEPNTKDNLEISINGLMGEYTQVDATKAELVNTVRVSWKGDETVFVFDGTECIGSLVASLDGTEDRYALLSTDTDHTVKAPASGTTTLTLVYSPLLTEAPAVNEGAISISLANQNGTKAPFVAYATLDYTGTTITDALVPFKFATSVIKVNCTGFLANTAINNATLSNVNTACKLTLSGTAAPTVAGDVNGTITRTGDEYFAASKVNGEGVAVFQIAAPVLETASEARVLRVEQGSVVYEYKNFSKKSLDAATSVNTVCFCIPTGSVRVERVSLDQTTLGLEEGSTFVLSATVYPDNAANKSVSWSSSDNDVATVDASGKVTAVSAGTADITVRTVEGSKTAMCVVTVVKAFGGDTLPGKFSVADGKQIHFSRGNLWYEAKTDTFHFEDSQYTYASNWNADHVSHFLWSKTASVAYAEAYNDTEASESDIFFTNSTEETANPNFTVNGITGKYRALSKAECNYLIQGRVVNDGKGEGYSYSLDITYGGQKGFVLYPDDYTEEIISGTITSLPEGVVFLPAAGGRDGSIIIGTNAYSPYWLASPTEGDINGAQFMDFNGSQFRTDNGNREIGLAVRLVTDVK